MLLLKSHRTMNVCVEYLFTAPEIYLYSFQVLCKHFVENCQSRDICYLLLLYPMNVYIKFKCISYILYLKGH